MKRCFEIIYESKFFTLLASSCKSFSLMISNGPEIIIGPSSIIIHADQHPISWGNSSSQLHCCLTADYTLEVGTQIVALFGHYVTLVSLCTQFFSQVGLKLESRIEKLSPSRRFKQGIYCYEALWIGLHFSIRNINFWLIRIKPLCTWGNSCTNVVCKLIHNLWFLIKYKMYSN